MDRKIGAIAQIRAGVISRQRMRLMLEVQGDAARGWGRLGSLASQRTLVFDVGFVSSGIALLQQSTWEMDVRETSRTLLAQQQGQRDTRHSFTGTSAPCGQRCSCGAGPRWLPAGTAAWPGPCPGVAPGMGGSCYKAAERLCSCSLQMAV